MTIDQDVYFYPQILSLLHKYLLLLQDDELHVKLLIFYRELNKFYNFDMRSGAQVVR